MKEPKGVGWAPKGSKPPKRHILIGVDPATHKKLKAAAEVELRPLTQFVLFHVLAAAERIIQAHEGAV